MSSDGKLLATGGSNEGRIKIWNVAGGELVKTLESGGGAVYTLDFDSTGKHVLGTTADSRFRAFEIASGAEVVIDATVGWGYHTWDVSRDGRFVAGPGKGGIILWDQKTWREVRQIPGNTGGTSFVTFSPDGRTLASTGQDGAVRLWDVRTGQLVSTPGEGLGGGSRLRFSDEGRKLVVWGTDRQMHLYGSAPAGRAPAPRPVAPPPSPVPPEFPDD